MCQDMETKGSSDPASDAINWNKLTKKIRRSAWLCWSSSCFWFGIMMAQTPTTPSQTRHRQKYVYGSEYRGEVDLTPFECSRNSREAVLSIASAIDSDGRLACLYSLNGSDITDYCDIDDDTVDVSLRAAPWQWDIYTFITSIKGHFDCRVRYVTRRTLAKV